MANRCVKCGSENVYYSRKKDLNICEDCGASFQEKEAFVSKKVFLSYGHDSNEELVKLIYDKLKERGHDPWIDRANIKAGTDWREAISRGILASTDFLAFISQHSVRVPGVCLDEISIGVGNWNCRIQSILVEKDVEVPNSINGIQWLDFSDWRTYRNGEFSSQWEHWFSAKMQLLYEVIEDQRATIVAGCISDLEKQLRPMAMALKLRLILRDGIVGRNWLVRRVVDWFDMPHAEPALVLFGTPGTGKSVMSAYLCNFSHRCAATFFFEWNNTQTRNPKTFLFSVMFQLACSLDDYRARLAEWLKGKNPQSMTIDELLNDGLVGLLNGLINGGRERKIIVLDAVDETDLDDGFLLDMLAKFIMQAPKWLRFFITSRPESDVLGKFHSFKCLHMESFLHEINGDLLEYVKRSVPNSEIVEAIIQRSAGSFVCARELTQLYLRNPQSFVADSLPEGVEGAYYANFERLCRDAHKYGKYYRPVLEVLSSAKEQISETELKAILRHFKIDVDDVLRDLRSYVLEVKHGGDIFLQIFHKTFREWLFSESAGKFRLSRSRADSLFCQYILEEIDNSRCLSRYVTRYAIEYITGRVWEELPQQHQEKLCMKLLDAARQYGSVELESKYLSLLEESFGRGYLFYINALELYKKVSGKVLEKIVDEAKKYMDSIDEEENRYELACQIAFSYFYMGDAVKAHDLMTDERRRHDDVFWTVGKHQAYYWHVLAVSAHDLDKNREVVMAAERDVEGYRMGKKFYDQYISMVNLLDGHMALANLDIAESIANKTFEYMEHRYFIGVDDILRICYGNLLQTEDRVMEALTFYEEGLRLAKPIQKWDYLYGSIWRELAMARFGDCHCLESLMKFRDQAKAFGYRYLISLADCFFVIAAFFLKTIRLEIITKCLEEIRTIGLPGHILQAEICCQLAEVAQENPDRVFRYLSECEGLKGEPMLVREYQMRFGAKWNEERQLTCKKWCDTYVAPIEIKRNTWKTKIRSGLSNHPKLALNGCSRCQAHCCYDGVYLEDGEAETIETFVNDHTAQFVNLPRPFIVQGDWPGLEGHSKTRSIPFSGYAKGFPSHFSHTRCVFQMNTGECSLQRVATDLQLHPWKIKPRACWLFPLRGVHQKHLLGPITNQKDDPDNIGENYPGYVSFLPCSEEDTVAGVEWYKKYEHELEFFEYQKRISQMKKVEDVTHPYF